MPHNKVGKFNMDSLPDLSGRIALVTGGNAGIGVPTVVALARKGAKVYLAARSEEKGREAIENIKEQYTLSTEISDQSKGLQIEFLKLDLSEKPSIDAAVADFRSKETKLHILVNNAGIMATPYVENSEGIEMQWATNYVGHFRLTIALLPCLLKAVRQSPKGSVRIVNVSSDGHKLFQNTGGIIFDDLNLKNAATMRRYGQSKLGNILFTKALKKHYGSQGIWVASLHPGIVNTTLSRGPIASYGCAGKVIFKVAGRFALSPEDGALQSIYCAASDKFKEEDSGEYFIPVIKKEQSSQYSNDEALADRLWEFSHEKYLQAN